MGFGTLYVGSSGIIAQSDWIQAIGNDLANVNTTGYKRERVEFEDLLYADTPGANGNVSQVGQGTRVSSILTDFDQGSVITGTSSTNMAISGDGFFTVKSRDGSSYLYTRSGDFNFDKDGYLRDSNGLVVQGWAMGSASNAAASVSGSPTDIHLSSFQCSPQATTHLDLITNLDTGAGDQSVDATDPAFSMFKQWNGLSSTPLGADKFAYSTDIKAYDSAGTAHTLRVYYDSVTASGAGGKKTWEYMVTSNPSDDGRTIGGSKMASNAAGGVLMIGTLTFSADGKLDSMNAYTLQSGAGDPTDLSSWQLASFGADGCPSFTTKFSGASNASTIDVNFGMSNTRTVSNSSAVGGWNAGSSGKSAADIGNNVRGAPTFQYTTLNALASTNYAAGSSTLYQNQDGYKQGDLESLSVSKDGVIIGHYSNGQTQNLYAVALADFKNDDGLRREGGNLYSATPDSGTASFGSAESGNLGSIAGKSLEQSNVDIGSSMVDMIIAQRSFQANTKIITTYDTILNDALQLKK